MVQNKIKSIYLDHPEIILAGMERIDPEDLLLKIKNINITLLERLEKRDRILLKKFSETSGDLRLMAKELGVSIFSVHRIMNRIKLKLSLGKQMQLDLIHLRLT